MNASKWFKGEQSPLAKGGESRKMSALRVFLIVAALHAVVLGPILVFEGCKKATPTEPNLTENTETTPPPSLDMAAPLPPPVTNPAQIPSSPLTPLTATVPPVATQPVAPLEAIVKTIKVQRGDSLWKISRAENVSIGDLMRVNNLTDKSVLQIGQELRIPAPSAATGTGQSQPTVAVAPTAPVPGEATHVVQAGDTLWGIARKYNTTVAALRAANQLTTNTLKVNQKLVIPSPSPQAATAPPATAPGVDPLTGGTVHQGDITYHLVGENDRLEIIAKRYGVSIKEVMEVNHITNPSAIRINQRLIIPVKAQTVPPAAPPMPEAPKTPVG